MAKLRFKPLLKIALVGKQVKAMVPSEGIPLIWRSKRSMVKLFAQTATITLMRRKNSRVPVKLTRKCCCENSGRQVCAVHWLIELREKNTSMGRLFNFTPSFFNKKVKEYALALGMDGAARASSHGFRRVWHKTS